MQRLLIIVPITAGLLIVGYFWVKPSSCDRIFEQTAPRIESKLEFLKNQAELVIGPEQVQKLGESSQKVGLHLKACCIMQSSAHMSAEQLQICIDGAKNYETRIVQMANLIGEAQAAREQGNAQLANERATQARQLNEAVSAAERQLQEVAAPDEPLPPNPKSTILPLKSTILPLSPTIVPLAAPSISPLKPTILPLKATTVPAGRSPPG